MKSIKWKLIAMYLGLVLIVMIVSGSFILISLQNVEMDKARTRFETYVQKVDELIIQTNYDWNFGPALEKETLDGTLDAQIKSSIVDIGGKVHGTTIIETENRTLVNTSLVTGAFTGTPMFSRAQYNTVGQGGRYLSYAQPIYVVGELKYVVYAVMEADDIYSSLDETRRTIMVSVFLALFMTALMGYVFAQTLTSPIVALTEKAKELAQGKLNQNIKAYSDDEIGQLTESFNYMARELNHTVNEIFREKNKFEVILHNMTDGVISFDHNGNVVHLNIASKELLDLENGEFTFDDFLKKFDINVGVYLDMMNSESTKTVDFWYGDRYIVASFSPLVSDKKELEGSVVVIQDNTELKKLDDMRKEFVANVSHELRTPLTTVKSYTETLIEGAIDERETAMEFLDIINNEADRMSFLVRDLLQLSRFDNKQIVLNYSRINLNEFIAENIRQSKIHAENKQQELSFTPYNGDAYINADKDRITQVFNNILTNAIKYSGNGAEITVWADETTSFYRVHVKDTGMGISKDDIARIFERFYRVDKARSRAMGGTGLGLAIAKEIMESHGGKITVESRYGFGTTMVIWFPKIAAVN